MAMVRAPIFAGIAIMDGIAAGGITTPTGW
jgi:hypothetical protein